MSVKPSSPTHGAGEGAPPSGPLPLSPANSPRAGAAPELPAAAHIAIEAALRGDGRAGPFPQEEPHLALRTAWPGTGVCCGQPKTTGVPGGRWVSDCDELLGMSLLTTSVM